MNSVESPVLLAPRAIVGSLFSIEALIILYVFAGMYKNDPRFAWIPADATGLFFALSVVIGSFIIVRKPISKKTCAVVFAMLAFVAWWAVTLIWSPSRIYGPDKVFLMATLNMWALTAAALIIAPNPERVRRFFTLLLLFALWMGIESLLFYREAEQESVIMVGTGYLGTGRVVGLGALVVFTAWLFGRRVSLVNVWYLVLFTGLCFVLMIAGGKAPLLAALVPLLVPLLFGWQVTRRRILYKRYQISIIVLASGLIAGLSIYVAATDRTPKSLDRLERMIQGGELQGTAAGRVSMYEEVFEFWPDAPLLGHGAGSWPVLQGIPDRQSYPHNIFLEVLVESGVVGLILLVALLGVALRQISVERLRNDPLALCALVLFVNAFLNAMVSGDLPDNRPLFMLLGLLTVCRERSSTPSTNSSPHLALALTAQPRRSATSLSLGRNGAFLPRSSTHI